MDARVIEYGPLRTVEDARERRAQALAEFTRANSAIDRLVFAERFWRWAATVEAALLIGVVVYWNW